MHCLWCFEQITPQMNWQNIVVLFKPKTLCNQCEGKLDELIGNRCSRCSRISEEEVCSDCIWWLRHTGQDVLAYNHSIYTYNSFIQDVIAKWKYRGDYQLGNVFKQPLMEAFSYKFFKMWPIVVPIPLSEERLTERGFNQAKMMADFLPGKSEEILKRVHGEKQSKKTRNERIFTDNPFILTKPIKKPVILVDDIYTTGTTIRHAAALLKKHGTPEIYSLTLIRG
ncbi:ComF family protein [Virgibacillus oceani]